MLGLSGDQRKKSQPGGITCWLVVTLAIFKLQLNGTDKICENIKNILKIFVNI